ncbi:MAG: lysophospholipid acyltransferase family protein [Acetobacteraceae bacterium]|nr:lysophospholipid acyltransferase family protein [Acetobacteraceae bacterium]
MKWLLRHPRTLALGAQALGAYLRFALRTTRWTLHGRDTLGSHLLGGPAIFAFWHERLPLMPALWTLALQERRGATRGRMHVLVSRHQDGRLIGAIMQAFGVDIVYGSSSRRHKPKGGVAGLRALAGVLLQGDQIVITPDGPRGPARKAAAGVAQLAALTQAPIFPCAAQTRRRRVLATWDRMVLPLPFGRGVLVCAPPILVPRDEWTQSLPQIEVAMTRAAEQADALCGA